MIFKFFACLRHSWTKKSYLRVYTHYVVLFRSPASQPASQLINEAKKKTKTPTTQWRSWAREIQVVKLEIAYKNIYPSAAISLGDTKKAQPETTCWRRSTTERCAVIIFTVYFILVVRRGRFFGCCRFQNFIIWNHGVCKCYFFSCVYQRDKAVRRVIRANEFVNNFIRWLTQNENDSK